LASALRVRVVPTTTHRLAKTFPAGVCGCRSPYPTVVSETTEK